MIDQHHVKPIFRGNFKVPLSSDVEELRLASVQYVKDEIDIASALCCPVIVHGSVIVEPRLVVAIKRIALNNYLKSLDELYAYARSKNVPLYLENLSNYKNYRPFHYIFTNEEEIDFILSRTDAKLFFDVGHANIGNNSPLRMFHKYHQSIVGMSLSNNNGMQDQHLSLNTGTIDYYEFVKKILAQNWQGIIAFETRGVTPKKSIEELNDIYLRMNYSVVA